jgi:hypothetical protein
MLLLLSLAAIGIGIALWSKVLTIQGIVSTGNVNAEYVDVFTDDDDFVDDPAFDELDTGDCAISVGPDDSPFGPDNDKDEPDGITSCDPSATGPDPKPHYEKDVARCDAILRDTDPDQEGNQGAAVAITNGYPSYHCTAWLFIINNGSIPVLLHSAQIQDAAARPCQLGATPYDLDGDGTPDVEICVSGLQCQTDAAGNIECLEPQIDPEQVFALDLDIHVMQTAPQGETLGFDAEVCLHQWNEETGNCPDASNDVIIDRDGFATATPGGPADEDVAFGDTLHAFPNSGADPRCGLDMFDQDGNGAWTFGANGDDLHCEQDQCPTGTGGAVHVKGEDCVVLDINGNLADGQAVDCDLDGLIPFTACPTNLAFHDVNGNGVYDNGEDIVFDGNGNGIFD